MKLTEDTLKVKRKNLGYFLVVCPRLVICPMSSNLPSLPAQYSPLSSRLSLSPGLNLSSNLPWSSSLPCPLSSSLTHVDMRAGLFYSALPNPAIWFLAQAPFQSHLRLLLASMHRSHSLTTHLAARSQIWRSSATLGRGSQPRPSQNRTSNRY